MRKSNATNPLLIELIDFLKKQARENKAAIWRDVAEDLARSRKEHVVVNLSHLNRHTRKNETVIVPGKVLGTGEIDHPITITAFAFSEKAIEKIRSAKGKRLSFLDLVKKNPKGTKARIIG